MDFTLQKGFEKPELSNPFGLRRINLWIRALVDVDFLGRLHRPAVAYVGLALSYFANWRPAYYLIRLLPKFL